MKRSFVIVIFVTLVFTVLGFQKVSSVPPGGDCDPNFEICLADGDDPGDMPDDEAPTIQVDTSPIYMSTLEMLDIPSCLAFDDNDPTIQCDMETNVDVLRTGTYEISYQATDNIGNTSDVETINVYVEKNYPLFTYPDTNVFMPEDTLIIDYSVRAFENNKLKARLNTDEDSIFYSFIVNQSNLDDPFGYMEVQLDEITYGDNVDLYLYDHEGELIYESTSNLNNDEEISFYAYPGVYYFEVRKVSVGEVDFRMDINGLTNYTPLSQGTELSATGSEIYVMEYTSQVVDIYEYFIPASMLKANQDYILDILDNTDITESDALNYFEGLAATYAITGGFLYISSELGASWAAAALASPYFAAPAALIGLAAGLLYFDDLINNNIIQSIVDTVAEGNVDDYIKITVTHIDGDRQHMYFNSFDLGVIENFDFTANYYPYVYQVDGIDVDVLYLCSMYDKEISS